MFTSDPETTKSVKRIVTSKTIQTSSKKVTATIFCDPEGVILVDFLEPAIPINSQ